jgi:hypothetical protein
MIEAAELNLMQMTCRWKWNRIPSRLLSLGHSDPSRSPEKQVRIRPIGQLHMISRFQQTNILFGQKVDCNPLIQPSSYIFVPL